MRLEFGKFLTCSGSNISSDDASRLFRSIPPPSGTRLDITKNDAVRVPNFIVYAYAEGYFVHVSDDLEVFEESQKKARSEGYSPSLLGLLKLAYENKCDFLRIDRDGPEVDGFTVFEW